MALHQPHEKEQLSAIEIELATAPKIQDDLKRKFGYGENIFFDLDLIEYRVNNSLLDIAEDLDLEERYNLINNQPSSSVSHAFRGHHNKEFMPEYQFDRLLGKITNDMIEKIRKKKGGLKASSMINPETGVRYVVESGRIGGLASAKAQGLKVWSLEEIVDIHNFREESIGKGRYKTLPCWNDTTSKMNEKYDEDWTTKQVTMAYHQKKDKLPEEE